MLPDIWKRVGWQIAKKRVGSLWSCTTVFDLLPEKTKNSAFTFPGWFQKLVCATHCICIRLRIHKTWALCLYTEGLEASMRRSFLHANISAQIRRSFWSVTQDSFVTPLHSTTMEVKWNSQELSKHKSLLGINGICNHLMRIAWLAEAIRLQ